MHNNSFFASEQAQQAMLLRWRKLQGSGIRFGNVVEPDLRLQEVSADGVGMHKGPGPHPARTFSEIHLHTPLQGDVRFDFVLVELAPST
jgi:hypothetical protein